MIHFEALVIVSLIEYIYSLNCLNSLWCGFLVHRGLNDSIGLFELVFFLLLFVVLLVEWIIIKFWEYLSHPIRLSKPTETLDKNKLLHKVLNFWYGCYIAAFGVCTCIYTWCDFEALQAHCDILCRLCN